MNLSEALKELSADIVRDIGLGKHISATRDDAEAASLAADIIDSLPKAEDGSVIWKGCWVRPKIECDDGYMQIISIVDSVNSDGSGEISLTNPDGSVIHDPWEFEASEILSTHRTRDEAEAAAAKEKQND